MGRGLFVAMFDCKTWPYLGFCEDIKRRIHNEDS